MTLLIGVAFAPAARRWLAETTRARVLNVFDRACNLVNSNGQVLSVVTSERGLTPFAVAVAVSQAAPFRAVTEASPVTVQAARLGLGPLEIDCSQARLWPSAPDWAAIRLQFADPALVDAMAALAFGRGPAGSLLELFDPAAPPGPAALSSSLPLSLRERAHAGAADLTAGLGSGNLALASAGARRLAGAGGGLTPAGDDFVLGALLAAWAGLYGPGAEALAGAIGEEAAARTTTLSGAYLRAAARGECSAYWHALFDAWLQPAAAGRRLALEALLVVGHTSGADALAGYLAARLVPRQFTSRPTHLV